MRTRIKRGTVELHSPYGGGVSIFVPNGERGHIESEAAGYVFVRFPAGRVGIPQHWLKDIETSTDYSD